MTVALALTGSNLCGDVPFAVALRRDDGAVRERRAPAGERSDLAALCRDLCRDEGVAPADLAELRVDVGPGSYTGLRVAVTFVRFLQAFGGADVLAVSSLALLAHHACAGRGDVARVRPLLDARRGRFHHARFALAGGAMTELEAPAADLREQVLAATAAGEVAVVPAALAAEHGDALRERGAEVVVAADLAAAALFAPGLPLASAAAAELEPRYLMGSYAEG